MAIDMPSRVDIGKPKKRFSIHGFLAHGDRCVYRVTKRQCRRIGAPPKWWLGRNDGDPIIRPLRDKEMGASYPRCQNQKRLYARIESDLVGFFKLVGSVFGRSGAASIDIVRRGRRCIAKVKSRACCGSMRYSTVTRTGPSSGRGLLD
jgi:hypothetical protein